MASILFICMESDNVFVVQGGRPLRWSITWDLKRRPGIRRTPSLIPTLTLRLQGVANHGNMTSSEKKRKLVLCTAFCLITE